MDTEWGSVGPGWDKLVQPLIDLCKLEGVEIHQIKEKFGTLRFYVGDAPERVHEVIQTAEYQSFQTCEECGEPGRLVNLQGWLKTACDLHSDEFNLWVTEVRRDAGIT